MDHAAFIVARIERARQERGISIAELGRRAQIDKKRLWYILNGERVLRADEFVRLIVVMRLGLQCFITPDLMQTMRDRQSLGLRDGDGDECDLSSPSIDKRAGSVDTD